MNTNIAQIGPLIKDLWATKKIRNSVLTPSLHPSILFPYTRTTTIGLASLVIRMPDGLRSVLCKKYSESSLIRRHYSLFDQELISYRYTHLVVVVVLPVGATSSKKPKAPPFQIGSRWNLVEISSRKHASISRRKLLPPGECMNTNRLASASS